MKDNLALVFTMHKVGSSSLKAMMEKNGYVVDRGYDENIHTLQPMSSYLKVVTAVRDPIARNISWFFEQNGPRVMQENMRNAQIYEFFLEKTNHHYPLNWFQDVYRLATGIDVFEHAPYDLESTKYFIYRTEELNIHRADTEETRPYGAFYHTFLEWIKLPKPYVDMMYNSKFSKHFFLEDELQEWRERWQE